MDPVAALVLARRAEHSKPGRRRDGFRLALAIEGGGMRGVVAGGMVSALEQLGLADVFDAVYGTSAGACAGAYLLAGQAREGTRIFYRDINNPRFIRIGRALIRRPVMNVDLLIDHVMTRVRPLDTARVIGHPVPLVMMATDVATGGAVMLRDFADHGQVMRGLRATTRLPLVAGRPVDWTDGRRLVDGALSAPLPVEQAAVDGATHVLALATRHDVSTIDGGRTNALFSRLLARHVSPAVAEAYLGRAALFTGLAGALSGPRLPYGGAPHVALVRPIGRWRRVSKVERRGLKLIRGADAGWQAVWRWLGDDDPPPFPDMLRTGRRLRRRET
ncbi:patatin-like phospholipase family protein [Zavarzinia compransoris]|uniref:Patatin n=1 Tax=Zavarzinia compransoris TaxID=1264899 RepID=A0A317E0S5_9PROT|nr:patatin-like phospholipase family protein [Zavarzinia compransoris]PWR19726.1 patatin [Zavarzinia compransoris]TDP43326.1 patatin-like phospholipase [Zavarzinia compransoris]